MLKLNEEQRKAVHEAAVKLTRIPWSDTPQGYAYWLKVHTNLHKLYDMTLLPSEKMGRDARMVLYGSPDVPVGYNTILGYLASMGQVDVLGDDPQATVKDGKTLSKVCKLECRPVHKVKACHALQDSGIEVVNAYPKDLLFEHFNPGARSRHKLSRAGPGSGRFRYTKRNPFSL